MGGEDVPTGENLILSASFEKDGEDPPGVSTGIVTLFHGDDEGGEARIKTQPAAFGLSGTDLTVGRAISNITDSFPGRDRGRSPVARSAASASTSAATPTSISTCCRRDDRPRVACGGGVPRRGSVAEGGRGLAEEPLDEHAVLPHAVEPTMAVLDADLPEAGGEVRGPAGLVVDEDPAGELVEPAAL